MKTITFYTVTDVLIEDEAVLPFVSTSPSLDASLDAIAEDVQEMIDDLGLDQLDDVRGKLVPVVHNKLNDVTRVWHVLSPISYEDYYVVTRYTLQLED